MQLGNLDISGEGVLHEWISAAFNSESDPDLLEGLELSGQVPRLGSCLASQSGSPKTLKQCPDLEQDAQAYTELCNRSFVAPKGRRILAIVSRYCDLDRMRGSVIMASVLFQIELRGNSIKDLRDFTQRVCLVFGAVPVAQRPDARLMGEWPFHRVKPPRKLERYIEDIRESGSSRRDFDFLWGKIQDVLVQDREDANVRSMLGHPAPPAKNPKAAAAKADTIPPPKPPAKPPSPDPRVRQLAKSRNAWGPSLEVSAKGQAQDKV